MGRQGRNPIRLAWAGMVLMMVCSQAVWAEVDSSVKTDAEQKEKREPSPKEKGAPPKGAQSLQIKECSARWASESADFQAIFRLGKSWCEEFRKFPVRESRLAVVELSLQNKGKDPIYLYFNEVRLRLPEGDQKIALAPAEVVGKALYLSPDRALTADLDDRGPGHVGIYAPGPVYSGGEIIVNPTNDAGVNVDLGGIITDRKAATDSMEKFVVALGKKEFRYALVRPGATVTGYLYFILPWSITGPDQMELILDGILGDGAPARLVPDRPATP